MKKIVQQWRIAHQTSSPGNSQANGAAEAAVKTAKRLLHKCKAATDHPFVGFTECAKNMGLSPAQILLGQITNTLVPSMSKL